MPPTPPLPTPPLPHLVLKCLHTDLQYAEQLVDVADLELAPPLAQQVHLQVLQDPEEAKQQTVCCVLPQKTALPIGILPKLK